MWNSLQRQMPGATRTGWRRGPLTAGWIGLPPDAARASMLVFLPKFTESWMRNADKYMVILNGMGNFTGPLKGKTINEVKPVLFDMRFIEKVKL